MQNKQHHVKYVFQLERIKKNKYIKKIFNKIDDGTAERKQIKHKTRLVGWPTIKLRTKGKC